MAETLNELVTKAQQLRAQGLNEEAIPVLQEVVRRGPDNLINIHNLAAALGDVGAYKEARDYAELALQKGLDRPETRLVYARGLAGMQLFDEAEAAYTALIDEVPQDGVVHRELAQLVWMRTGDRVAALSYLEDVVRQQPALLGLQILKAELLGQMGDATGQLAVLKELLGSAPDDPQILYFAARAAQSNEDFVTALDLCERALAKLPVNTPDQEQLAAVYVTALLAVGDAKAAEAAIRPLRQRSPDNQYYIALQATAWRQLKDEQYHKLFDYDSLVFAAPLGVPDGWRTLDAYLSDLTAELEEAHHFREHPFFLSVRHGSQISSITRSEKPAMRAFKVASEVPLNGYLDHLRAGSSFFLPSKPAAASLFSAWSVMLPPNGFHVNHVHPDGWISSACHICPQEDDPDKPKAGWLKFGEPGCATDPDLLPEYHIKPQAGQMVFFPSYMWHGTESFTKGASRLTVAADFKPARP